jgi:hypothetical protein
VIFKNLLDNSAPLPMAGAANVTASAINATASR